MTCYADYSYQRGLVSGGGRFEAVTAENSVSTRIDLRSVSSFALNPPTIANVAYCTADISTNANITFQDDALGSILLTDLVSNLVDEKAASGRYGN
jgi:hypothetical protein